jgi:tRNA-2-methylthio-N6-dimethylallyladenosine synthase
MNERESASVAAALRAKGYTIVDDEKSADIVLINSCAVRDLAELKAIGKAGRMIKRKRNNPNIKVGIMGCMAQNRGRELLRSLPDLDLIIGTQKFHRIPEHLDAMIATREGLGPTPSTVIDIGEEAGSVSATSGHSLEREVCAFVTIQQGCNMHCAYCIVPKTRGDERSRPMEEILDEIRALAANGTREVMLLGQIVTSYGRDLYEFVDGKSPFVQLLEKIEGIDGIARVRFTSPHPTGFKEDLINCYGRLGKLCESVHLPLQSGSDRILKEMRRPYSRQKYFGIVRALRERVPGMDISTDIIVGFPGETDADFAQTAEAFDEVGFDMAYIFKYSRRSGTPAAEMDGQVDLETMKAREAALLKLLHKHSLARNESLVGTTQEVLVEGLPRKGEGVVFGRNRGGRKIIFPGEESLIGKLVNVRIESATVAAMEGRIILD